MTMEQNDDWTGAIVRHRDLRKGRVLREVRTSRTSRTHTLMVHWDDDTTSPVDARTVRMLRPPLGFGQMMPTAREDVGPLGPRWAWIGAAVCLLLIAGMVAAYVALGAA